MTVATQSAGLKVETGPRRPVDTAIVSGRLGDGAVHLRDGRYLKLVMKLYLDPRASEFLKVENSVFQYQADGAGDRWIVRYEYIRTPADRHPGMHLHVRGELTEPNVLPPSRPLERIHFPTDRVSCEAVVRLLVEQFNVPTRDGPEMWRPVFALTEEAFTRIAHRSPSGPAT
jgi:hypothetical protein